VDTGLLLASRLGVPPFSGGVVDELAGPLIHAAPQPGSPPSAAWIQEAVGAAARHQRSDHVERAWPLLRVLEPLAPALLDRDPASAGRVIGALATQALVEGDVEAFLDRAGRAAEAFDRAGAAGAAAFERATLGAGYRVLGVWDEAEGALRAALGAATPEVEAWVRLDLATVTAARGGGDEARGLAGEAAVAFARRGNGAGEGVARVRLAGILAAQGEGAAAEAEARRAGDLLAGSAAGRALAGAALARGLLAQGKIEAALAAAEDAHREMAAVRLPDEGEVGLLVALADARRAAGNAAGAAAALGEARRRVLADASRLRNPVFRQAFLGVPEHRRALEVPA
jgi:hypothetical protein